MVEKSGVEKIGIGKFMVEKSGVEKSRVEAWDWKFRGWNVLQPNQSFDVSPPRVRKAKDKISLPEGTLVTIVEFHALHFKKVLSFLNFELVDFHIDLEQACWKDLFQNKTNTSTL